MSGEKNNNNVPKQDSKRQSKEGKIVLRAGSSSTALLFTLFLFLTEGGDLNNGISMNCV